MPVACLLMLLCSITAFGAEAEEYVPAAYATFWALIPPIVAIGLALITKEVYSSLFVGILVGSGDIDNRIAAKDKDAMQLGAKLHRKIQRRMGAAYHPEVTLRHVEEFDRFSIQVEGRADGVIMEDTVCIDEIKGILLRQG